MLRPEGDRSAALPPSRGALVGWSLTLVAVTTDILLGGPLSRFDHRSLPWLLVNLDLRKLHHLHQHQKSELVLVALTQFGARSALLLVVPYLVVVSVRRRTVRPLARLALLGLLVIPVVYGAKAGFGRTGPVHDRFLAGGRSYPSGHSVNAVVLWGLVAWTAVEHGTSAAVRRVAGVLRWLAPLCTATCMFLLGYHWFTDVVAGVAVGVLVLGALHAADRAVWGRPGLAHWPGARRGVAGGGAGRGGPEHGPDRDRLDVGGARGGGGPGAVHDPGPADR